MFLFPRILFLVVVVLFLLSPQTTKATATNSDDESRRSYIIHVRPPPPEHKGSQRDWHESFLPDPSHLLHSYSHVLSGFSANLTPTELESIRNLDGFIHAATPTIVPLHTTHTPSFLHLNRDPSGFWAQSSDYGEGAIIAILDTGIDPNHPSFNGSGLPTPPSKWKGTSSFSLNTTTSHKNKIVGARTFKNGKEISSPPIDDHSHGTHVAGIAAGNFVPNASVLGSAMGVAAGMAPRAHLAAYKVCWNSEDETACDNMDITAGIDMAVADGVDVISLSLGGPPDPLDPVDVAAFAAVKKGVFVTMSAGNDGPDLATVNNISPWVLTVGASTVDRRIRAVVKLGSGAVLEGESAYQPSNLPNYLPLVLPQWVGDENSSYCTNVATLRHVQVEGKVVVCKDGINQIVEKGKIVKEAGGAAMIVCDDKGSGYDTSAVANVIPASYLNYLDGSILLEYISSNVNPTATIEFLGTAIGGSSDPAVAAFSSRGPSIVDLGILKPDIIGPGVNILAAWSTPVGAFPVYPPFNMISGTSMACPHLAGVAALLKRSHPDWSPAMVKSAIMTTADVTNLGGDPILDSYDGSPASFFAIGAGHVNPARANNPGLVYDITTEDYVGYLCGLSYTLQQVRLIAGNDTIECANYQEADLNYPSISAVLSNANGHSARVGRTLTNVGRSNGSYIATVISPHGVTMDVKPATLEFRSTGEKKSFTVEFGINQTENTSTWWRQGQLIWTSLDSVERNNHKCNTNILLIVSPSCAHHMVPLTILSFLSFSVLRFLF